MTAVSENSVTFIHTSDFQLGMTRWFLSDEAQSRFADARLAAIARLGDLARDTGAELIVVAGDVFEHNALSAQTTGRAREALGNLPVPVYLLPGNHDPLVADSVFFTAATSDNVVVIDDATPRTVRPGVEIVGAPYRSKRAGFDLVAAALSPLEPTDTIRVLVGHGQTESRSSAHDPDQIDLPTVSSAIESAVVDYVALGDTHSTQSLGTTGAVWFSGAPEVTDFREIPGGGGESDSGNALVVTVTKQGASRAQVSVDKQRVGTWSFQALTRDINSAGDVDEFLADLRACPHKERTAIKYALRGTITLSDQARLEAGLAELQPIFAALYPRESKMDLHLAPGADELDSLNLHGYAAAALEDLVGELDSGDDTARTTARDAVNLLFRLTNGSAAKA